ncbi:hypothetical protein FUT87_00890 [Mitsuaria sp. TWR114]|jgi:hypothetical protein|uniref:pilus assembly PilX family protein n=1 Tax=unclassified Roseateles TaxID=2626991 RepID=UPI0008E95173|nr:MULTISPECIES: hypothetical protein [unclassified Roseateles]MBB3283030.1 Tfp pilus assembly protein PilX [Mitsuaria sp. BK037]TXE00247.1 hypothetical protein FUT87_00890 [Mitsuaria sp. TWR114]SFR89717.1 hypothetical protein SAMN05428960_2860 [Mitsuaria sp. PDC51]
MRSTAPTLPKRQRGVIMVIALITLAVLLIGAAAAMKSMNVTLASVGYFGFKREMTNQSERAIRLASTALSPGGALALTSARWTSNAAQNYSATMLPSDASGIPLALLDTTTGGGLSGLGSSANEIKLASDNVTVHYLIDRLCLNTGAFDPANCQMLGRANNFGAKPGNPKPQPQPTYRITVRVTGPHNAYSFYQSTFTTLN